MALGRSDWSISELWNDLITEERNTKPREYIRASEIGKPYLDRYLAMKGVAPTNPFSARLLRVFDSGNIFETMVIERIFRLSGLLIESQTEVKLELPGLLPVIGHHDPKVGGKIDLKKIEEVINNVQLDEIEEILENNMAVSPKHYKKNMKPLLEQLRIPAWMARRVRVFAEKIAKKYPTGLRPMTTEIKTVNSQAFWAPKNQDKATQFFKGYLHHKLQLLTYLMANNEPQGRLFYISKDDLTLMETAVFENDKELKKLWFDDIAEMTNIWQIGKEPDAEKAIVYNKERDIWETNWLIKRSPYFTYITGFAEVKEWEQSLSSVLRQKNNAECLICKKSFTKTTLNKNNGTCARCAKLKTNEKGGEIINE